MGLPGADGVARERFRMTNTPQIGGWKATVAVSMSNYIEAGSIIALATSLTLWQEYFGFSNLVVGLIAHSAPTPSVPPSAQ